MKRAHLIATVLCATFMFISCNEDDIEPLNDQTPIDENPIENPENPENPPSSNNDAQFPCENGFADIYPCNSYDLMAHISIEMLAGALNAEGNDSWGWTDPISGKEYALVCSTHGTAFVDISNPSEPILLGRLATASSTSIWRDVKVYNNYAFIVSEAANHGMQVFDLTKLRDVENPPVQFTEDAHYSGFGSAHNIVINEESGYAYIVGSNAPNLSGGPHFINIQNPLNPIGEGGFSGDGYSHDAQVVTYNGPDQDYQNHEILIGSNADNVVLVDVTDKSNPTIISTVTYNNIGYTHQGWFTDDMTYFVLGDEVDEMSYGNNTRTLIFDFTDLDNPNLYFDYFGPTAAIDHNGYVNGNMFYLANYNAGVRFVDISGIGSQSMTEVGFFDTYPENDNTGFHGAWNVYPFFNSGNIIISDIDRGLFIVKHQ